MKTRFRFLVGIGAFTSWLSAYAILISTHRPNRGPKDRLLLLHDEGFSLGQIAQEIDLRWADFEVSNKAN